MLQLLDIGSDLINIAGGPLLSLTPIHFAAAWDFEMLQMIVEAGGDLTLANDSPYPPVLRYAIRKLRPHRIGKETMEYLVGQGCKLSIGDRNYLAMHRIQQTELTNIVLFLLDVDVDIHAQVRNG